MDTRQLEESLLRNETSRYHKADHILTLKVGLLEACLIHYLRCKVNKLVQQYNFKNRNAKLSAIDFKFYCSSESLQTMYGFSKFQIFNAVKKLEDFNLISTEIKNITYGRVKHYWFSIDNIKQYELLKSDIDYDLDEQHYGLDEENESINEELNQFSQVKKFDDASQKISLGKSKNLTSNINNKDIIIDIKNDIDKSISQKEIPFVQNEILNVCDEKDNSNYILKDSYNVSNSNRNIPNLNDNTTSNIFTYQTQDNARKVPKNSKSKELQTQTLFDKFWQLYPKKIAKYEVEKKFAKLTSKEIETIFETLPNFIVANQNFLPHPTTYINQKRWNDELQVNEFKLQTIQSNIQNINILFRNESIEIRLEKLKKFFELVDLELSKTYKVDTKLKYLNQFKDIFKSKINGELWRQLDKEVNVYNKWLQFKKELPK